MRRTAVLVVLVVLAALALAGCSAGSGSPAGQGYVGGDGTVDVLPVGQRQAPGTVAGTTIDGKPIALSDYAGRIVVVNIWGSWCTECRVEAPDLATAAHRLAKRGVVFLGIDSRDLSGSNARAFVRHFHVPYPSIYDQSGRTLLAFRGTLTPNAIPSTVIIDARGRVAASVLGRVTTTTLVDLVDRVARSDRGAT